MAMVAVITTASTLLEASTVDVTLDLNFRPATRRNVEVGYSVGFSVVGNSVILVTCLLGSVLVLELKTVCWSLW